MKYCKLQLVEELRAEKLEVGHPRMFMDLRDLRPLHAGHVIFLCFPRVPPPISHLLLLLLNYSINRTRDPQRILVPKNCTAYYRAMTVDPISHTLFRLPPALRLIFVLSGAILIHLTIGTYHTFGNMLPYMASYMRNYTDKTVKLEDFMWIPTFQGCFPFSMVIGGCLISRLGPRATAFLGCTLITGSVALSYYAIRHSFLAFFITYGLVFGLGMGIAYVTAVVTVINWAPDKVGLVSGLVVAGFGISSSIFAPIQTSFVNPDNLPATKDGYFLQKELLERVPSVFLRLAFIYGAMQLIGLLVICDPPERVRTSGCDSLLEYFSGWGCGPRSLRPGESSRYNAVRYRVLQMEDPTPVSSDAVPRRRSSSRDSRGSDISDDVFASDDEEELIKTVDLTMTPSEVLRSRTFHFLFAALFCCSFYGNMFYNLYKTFAESFIEDDFFLALAFSVGSIANAFARIGWGYMADRTSFQTAVSIATCCAATLLLSIISTPYLGRYAFLLWLTGIYTCMGAAHALFITATVKCFGSKHKATNYGFLILSTTCSGVILSIVSQFYLHSIGYNWLFMVTAAFPFCAFLVTANIHNTPQGRYIS